MKKKELTAPEPMEVSKTTGAFMTSVLSMISLVFLAPIVLVFSNSFKSKLYISKQPFSLPNAEPLLELKIM